MYGVLGIVSIWMMCPTVRYREVGIGTKDWSKNGGVFMNEKVHQVVLLPCSYTEIARYVILLEREEWEFYIKTQDINPKKFSLNLLLWMVENI